MQSALIQLVILFIIMFIGFILGKTHIVTEEMGGKLGKLVLSGTFPLLIITSMDRDFEMSTLRNSIIIMIATLIIMLLVICFVEIETRRRKNPPSTMTARHYLMLFGNSSFMGMPVLTALYGTDGVFYAAVMNAVVNVFLFSYGIFILKRSEHPSPRKIFLNPGFIGTVIGFILFLTPISLPYILFRPLQWVGDMTIPLACILAGSVISQHKLREIVTPASVWYTSLIRIVIYPCILIPALLLLRMDHFLLSILVILWSTPAPLTAGAFVGGYGGDGFFANKVVVLSNILSIFTMTAMIYIFTVLIV